MLRVRGLTKKFGNITALNNVDLSIKKECLGIIGPNGAGKTTLFNIISGFLKPDRGKVTFNGVDITGKRPSKIVKMGIVRTFQIIKIFKNLTVLENLSLICENEMEILKDFGLWSKRDLVASKLSQGEMRKLSIALAIATKPKVLMLDEPFSGLSPRECMELHGIIEDFKDGISIAIIEHKLKELFNLVDRVVVLNHGEILCEGEPDQIVRDSRVIRAYIGEDYA